MHDNFLHNIITVIQLFHKCYLNKNHNQFALTHNALLADSYTWIILLDWLSGKYGELSFNDFILKQTVVILWLYIMYKLI